MFFTKPLILALAGLAAASPAPIPPPDDPTQIQIRFHYPDETNGDLINIPDRIQWFPFGTFSYICSSVRH